MSDLPPRVDSLRAIFGRKQGALLEIVIVAPAGFDVRKFGAYEQFVVPAVLENASLLRYSFPALVGIDLVIGIAGFDGLAGQDAAIAAYGKRAIYEWSIPLEDLLACLDACAEPCRGRLYVKPDPNKSPEPEPETQEEDPEPTGEFVFKMMPSGKVASGQMDKFFRLMKPTGERYEARRLFPAYQKAGGKGNFSTFTTLLNIWRNPACRPVPVRKQKEKEQLQAASSTSREPDTVVLGDDGDGDDIEEFDDSESE